MSRAPITPPVALALLLSAALTGCVKKSTHESVLADLSRVRAEREEMQESLEADLQECRDEAEADARDARATETRLREDVRRLEARSRQAEARFEEARGEVHRLEVFLSERGSEYRRLEQQLQALRGIEREVRERNRIYEEVIDRFRSLIDSGRLSVAIQRGRMVIQLPQDVLFESGSASLAADGRRTLQEVGTVLAELEDRRFQVEGHTDNVPISTSRFPSNWELSSARALSVVRLLTERGVAPDRISAAGYGEFQPVADNGDREGRRRNRRIEIVMLPNLDLIAGAELPG